MKAQRRPAFTLIELLVIIAILAFLAGLLLPAVQKVRQAARRRESQNNLHQIAIAALNYEAAFMRLPPGNDGSNFSAFVRFLPYLEQAAAYQQANFMKDVTDNANAEVRKLRIKVFLSPRDPQTIVNEEYGPTNYLFSAGSKPSLEDNDGIFYQNSRIRLTDVTDGTSNTIIIGETLKGDGATTARDAKRQHVSLDRDALKDIRPDAGVSYFKNNQHIAGDRCASWMDGRFLQGTFTATLSLNDERPDVTCSGLGGVSALRSMDQITNIAFCDGSVHAVHNKVDAATWKALSTRNGGEVVNIDF